MAIHGRNGRARSLHQALELPNGPHTAITNVDRATKDLYLTQRFDRHSSPLTTTVYTHPRDEELYAAIRGIRS